MSYLMRIMIILLPMMLVNFSCSSDAETLLGEINKEKSEEIRRLIKHELREGSSSVEIENFFEKHEIANSYDRFAQRYQAIIRNVSPESKFKKHAVVIYVYVNEKKEFTKAEVKNSLD